MFGSAPNVKWTELELLNHIRNGSKADIQCCPVTGQPPYSATRVLRTYERPPQLTLLPPRAALRGAMRDRGITKPNVKATVAAALTVGGLIATLWSFAGPTPVPGSAEAFARSLGTVTAILGAMMTANYIYAMSLVRKLRRGEGVIASWTVPTAEFDHFRGVERARKSRRNNWRMPRGDWPSGLPVAFGANAVLVGETYFKLLGRGMSRFANVRLETDAVSSVEFATRLTVIGAGTLSQTARYRGHLRVPIAKAASVQAARVISHYQQVIAI